MSNDFNIAMWSGPRNLSTALMRSFANRTDVKAVFDEPFYASYLVSTNKDHPLKNEIIDSQINEIDGVKKLCQKKTNGITYQKHMTQHIIDNDLSWLDSLCNCFLIRSPKLVVSSFMKSLEHGQFEDIGFSQQYMAVGKHNARVVDFLGCLTGLYMYAWTSVDRLWMTAVILWAILMGYCGRSWDAIGASVGDLGLQSSQRGRSCPKSGPFSSGRRIW